MNLYGAFSRRSFVIVVLMSLLLLASIDGLLWFGIDMAMQEVSALGRLHDQAPEIKDFVDRATSWGLLLNAYFLPLSAAVFVLFSLFLWLFLRIANANLFKIAEKPTVAEKRKRALDSVKTPDTGKKEQIDKERRLFLHMLSLLQREGRLMDFFSENLEMYEDDQIGAAVRSIHQDCKKVIEKNLSPGAVIDKNEGEEVTVEPAFDPNAVKLTGNVAGDPPFKGVLRHKGWLVRKLELPTLSSVGDANIIAPAEVEII